MKVLLLGGNGFIGRNLKEYFQKFLPEIELYFPTSKELNLLDEILVRKFLEKEKFDVVIHGAIGNPRRDSFCSTISELEQDLKMFFHLERYHSLYGKMLYFGSGAELNKQKDIISAGEEYFINGVPTSSYGLAKYIIGQAIEKSNNIYNLRIFGLFGKYENWKTTFISGACCKALKNIPITIRQNVFFDYLYIDDFCRAVSWFIKHNPQFHTYHITSGNKIDLVSIAQTVKRLSKKNVPVYVCRQGLANEYTSTNYRLLAEWPEFKITDFDKAVEKLLEYYQAILDEIDLYSLLYQN